MIPILADIESQGLEVMLYLFLGAALLVLSFFILRLIQENGYRLILLALLIATVGIGFDAFLPDTAPIRSQTLMRIAVIVALGGVGSLLLSAEKSSTPTVTRRRKGAKDAD
ncbi:MAG: hypothetical protein JSW47_14390 [Phycisphaerales bacterium]|nr:MAG: hypothetical protein JSW47_14390 [Phycisphaerales bacterium]